MKFLITTLLLTISLSSNAAIYTFIQEGFSEGAYISGSFTAEDLNLNGEYSSLNGEITDFYLEFSGNSFIPVFTASFNELFGLSYEFNNGAFLGDDENITAEGLSVDGISADISAFIEYSAGLATSIGSCDGVDICASIIYDSSAGFFEDVSTEAIIVNPVVEPTAVPIPATSIFLLASLLSFISRRR